MHCFHLLNDFSGSPKVLAMILRRFAQEGMPIHLVTSRGGALDSIEREEDGGKREEAGPWSAQSKDAMCAVPVRHSTINYSFSNNPLVTLLRFARAQVKLFAIGLRCARGNDNIFYINTIMPLGAALAGRIAGKRIVYHYHENAYAKGAFYKFLAWWMQRLADEIICVSASQASQLKRKRNVHVVPNALSPEFIAKLKPDAAEAFLRKRVLMLSSLKGYKGTDTFIRLANRLPQYRFDLVINDSQENIDSWLKGTGTDPELKPGPNLHIHPRMEDVSGMYNDASLVLNLSNPRQVVETYGMTALEAMSAGLPVIVPPVGGIAEMVEDDVNGYRIDPSEIDSICSTITAILSDGHLYRRLSGGALATASRFSLAAQCSAIRDIMETFPATQS